MYIDSPNISGSLTITGSLILNGTAVTASGGGGGSGAGFPFSGSAVITGSLYVSGGNLSGSFVGDGSGLTNVTTTIDQFATVNDTFTNVPSHSVVHNFGTKDVFVQVFESDDTLLIPQTVTTTNTNQVDIVFGDTLSGRVVIGKAGHILQDTGNFVSSSTAVQTFTNATTASINHYLDSFNVITQVFDSNNNVIVPSNIKVATKDRVDLTFASSRSGKVVIAKAGHIVSGTSENAVSASYAVTSSIAQRVQAGTTVSRDLTTPQSGSLWFNTGTSLLEVYSGVSGSEWEVVGSQALPPVSVDYLIVAGGGAGGYNYSGGGGAGGLRTSYGSTSGGGSSAESSLSLNQGTTYTITVGAGGTGTSGDGNDGVASSIIGTGLSVTSTGGGGGASNNGTQAGHNGGSGGGGSESPSPGGPGGSGTSGQGYGGGTGYYGSGAVAVGGGGGGASAAGTNGASTVPGNGGNGVSVSITGTSTTYAGGGGGGSNGNGGGTGGTGGGGAGSGTGAGTAGSTNTGGGGGGSDTVNGGAGGSGIVILRMLTSKYSGTTTGSPTVTTDGTDTILTFTSSGTYTA